jgi:membrane associated rhomboid family serine protease
VRADLPDRQGPRRFVEDWIGRPPVLTIAGLLLLSVFMGLQTVEPSVLAALRRDLPAVQAGEWWRLLSPLLVQSDGWPQFAFNFAGLAILGAAIERRCGRWWWLALVLAGAAAGEAAGYAWDPHGAGSSVAVCGLLGGLLAFTWRHDRRDSWPLEFSFYWMASLAGLALLGPTGAVAACVALALIVGAVRARGANGPAAVGIAVAAMLAGALLLCALMDEHGPPVLAGALAGLLVRPRGWPPA